MAPARRARNGSERRSHGASPEAWPARRESTPRSPHWGRVPLRDGSCHRDAREVRRPRDRHGLEHLVSCQRPARFERIEFVQPGCDLLRKSPGYLRLEVGQAAVPDRPQRVHDQGRSALRARGPAAGMTQPGSRRALAGGSPCSPSSLGHRAEVAVPDRSRWPSPRALWRCETSSARQQPSVCPHAAGMTHMDRVASVDGWGHGPGHRERRTRRAVGWTGGDRQSRVTDHRAASADVRSTR